MSDFSRRELILAGLGLMVGGCAERIASIADRPRPDWPAHLRPPTDASARIVTGAPVVPVAPSAPPATASGALHAIPRSSWTRSGPVAGRVNSMNGVNRITVHHEGWRPFWATDSRHTAARIEQIRAQHVRDRGWGDIGYHYIIDRTGRVWQGRDLRYQGAHVRDNNPHNVGVMVLGNFDEQAPSSAQMTALEQTLRALTRRFGVPANRVFTHQELMPTACPGRRLQPQIARLRSTGRLA